jgi:hypothetical protein
VEHIDPMRVKYGTYDPCITWMSLGEALRNTALIGHAAA